MEMLTRLQGKQATEANSHREREKRRGNLQDAKGGEGTARRSRYASPHRATIHLLAKYMDDLCAGA